MANRRETQSESIKSKNAKYEKKLKTVACHKKDERMGLSTNVHQNETTTYNKITTEFSFM